MPLVDAKCTNCGATLKVDNLKEAAVCEHCGSAFIVEKAINNYNYYLNINSSTTINSQNTVVVNSERLKLEEKIQFEVENAIKNKIDVNWNTYRNMNMNMLGAYLTDYPGEAFGYEQYIVWSMYCLPSIEYEKIPTMLEDLESIFAKYKNVKNKKNYDRLLAIYTDAKKNAINRYSTEAQVEIKKLQDESLKTKEEVNNNNAKITKLTQEAGDSSRRISEIDKKLSDLGSCKWKMLKGHSSAEGRYGFNKVLFIVLIVLNLCCLPLYIDAIGKYEIHKTTMSGNNADIYLYVVLGLMFLFIVLPIINRIKKSVQKGAYDQVDAEYNRLMREKNYLNERLTYKIPEEKNALRQKIDSQLYQINYLSNRIEAIEKQIQELQQKLN